MSSPMISLDITSAQHAAQQQCRMASLQAHDQPAKQFSKTTYFKRYYSSKHKLSQVITHKLNYSFKFDALRGSDKLFFPLMVMLAMVANLRGYEVLACSHLYYWNLTQILNLKSFIDWPPWILLLFIGTSKKTSKSWFLSTWFGIERRCTAKASCLMRCFVIQRVGFVNPSWLLPQETLWLPPVLL